MTASSSQSGGPLAVAKAALDRSARLGLASGLELEFYVEFGRTTTIKVFGGSTESVEAAEPRGMGIRAITQGRVGYSYTADLTPAGIDKTVLEAAADVAAADSDPFQALPDGGGIDYPVLPGLCHPGVGTTGLDRKVEIALEAERAALAHPQVDTVETAEYMDGEDHIAIVSSRGIKAEGEHSFCFAYAYALAGGETDRQSGLGFTMGREPGVLDPVQAGKDAARKAAALLGASPCKTGSYTVVFDRMTAAALLAMITSSFSAEAVQKGRSVFAGKLGQQVASSRVNLVDDGLRTDGPSSSPFDAEGVPQRVTGLIENGNLKRFLHSSYTACKDAGGTSSTGNASRGSYRSLPGVGATNLVLQAGDGTLEELVARVGQGLYVESLAGLHSGVNPITGEISVGVTGRLIEGGTVGRPVREVTIATDFTRLLGSVSDLAGDARWIPVYGSVFTPSFAVEGIAVSGR